jgi:hypothetical protein
MWSILLEIVVDMLLMVHGFASSRTPRRRR